KPSRPMLRDRVFCKGEAHCFAPSLVASRNGMTGRRIGHRKQPPTLLRSKSEPVANGDRYQSRVRILDGPGKEHQFLTQGPGNRVTPRLPFAWLQTLRAQPLVEFDLDGFGDVFPLQSMQDDAHLCVLRAEGDTEFLSCLVLLPGEML